MSDYSDQELMSALAKRLRQQKGDIDDLQKLNAELAAANARLKEVEAVKSNFLSNIRNEIVNPLAAILGLAQQCMQRERREGCAGVGGQIFNEAYRLNFQLQNIFAAAELEAGESVFAPSRIDVSTIIAEIIDELQVLVQGKQLRFEIGNGDSCMAVTDAPKLHLVLLNLLANAAEFSGREGVVEVRLQAGVEGVAIEIRDHGPGIAKESLEKIFDRFRQLDEGTTKAYPGQGLGLSVSKAMVELLGGAIEVESEPGAGCTVKVMLPNAGETDFGDEGEGIYLASNVQLF